MKIKLPASKCVVEVSVESPKGVVKHTYWPQKGNEVEIQLDPGVIEAQVRVVARELNNGGKVVSETEITPIKEVIEEVDEQEVDDWAALEEATDPNNDQNNEDTPGELHED